MKSMEAPDILTERAVRQSGAAEVDVSLLFQGTRGAASTISGAFTVGTRAERLAAVGMQEGDRFLESDTGWEYYFSTLAWAYALGINTGTDAARGAITPTSNDNNALFFATDTLGLWEVVAATWTKRLEIAGTANQITASIAAGVLALALSPLVPQRLASVSINLNTTSVQDVYTVPTGKTLIPTLFIIRSPTADVSGVALALAIRSSAGPTVYWTFDNSTLTGSTRVLSVVPGDNAAFVDGLTISATNKVQVVLGTPFGSAATATAEVIGYLI